MISSSILLPPPMNRPAGIFCEAILIEIASPIPTSIQKPALFFISVNIDFTSRKSHLFILLCAGTATNPNGADYLAIDYNWYATL